MIDGLDPFTVYHVRIAAATSAGLGTYSETTFTRTASTSMCTAYGSTAVAFDHSLCVFLPAEPVAMVNITSVLAGGPYSLVVTWVEPEDGIHTHPDNITCVIQYQPVSGENGSVGNITLGCGNLVRTS